MQRKTAIGPKSTLQNMTPPAPRSPHPMRHLQRTLGNQAANRIMQGRIISEPDDRFEQEAEQLAGQLTSLPRSTQDIMQRKVGDDFPKVQIHNDLDAHKSAEALGAQAFTVGNDIFFARGSYNPGSAEANPVLAHELAHVALHSPSDSQPVIRPLFGKKEPVPIDWRVGWEPGPGFGHSDRVLIVDSFTVEPDGHREDAINATLPFENDSLVPKLIVEDQLHPRRTGGHVFVECRLIDPALAATSKPYAMVAEYRKVRKKPITTMSSSHSPTRSLRNRLRKQSQLPHATPRRSARLKPKPALKRTLEARQHLAVRLAPKQGPRWVFRERSASAHH